MATFVLVHGGFTDGAFWGETAAALVRAGHRPLVAELPSTGPVAEALGGLADDVAEVRRVVEGAGEPVVLVGHSYGGVVLGELGDHPDVARAVHVAAFRPPRGGSALDMFGALPGWAVVHPSGLAVTTVDDPEVTRAVFCAEMDPVRWRRWHEHLCRCLTSIASASAPVTAPEPAHPVTYVLCERDGAAPPATQEAMAAGADRLARFATSHWPMYADPAGFLALLETEAAAVDAPGDPGEREATTTRRAVPSRRGS